MSPRLWPGEKSTIIWSVQPLNPLPVSYLCHCCWWQIGDNKSHKMFIVPGFYPPCFWAECPSREQYPSRPWPRSSVSVRDHPQSSHVAAFIVILSVSVSGSDGGFTRQVRYWVTTWGLSAWPRDLSRITRCSVSLCLSPCHLRRTSKQRLRFKEFRISSFMKFKFSKRALCWLK